MSLFNISSPIVDLELYTNHLTPNGLKVSIYLEKLKAIYPNIHYTIHRIDIPKGVNKEPWFMKLNPNGRIPVLVDHSRNDFVVFESAAILLYLAQHYDERCIMTFDPQKHPSEYSTMLQWIFFAHGGVGPTQGQAHFFRHYCPEDVPYGKKRYTEETKRLYGVLDIGLQGRDWLAGSDRGKFSIADANVLPWIRLHQRADIENLAEWPNLQRWFTKANDQPSVKAAIESVAL